VKKGKQNGGGFTIKKRVSLGYNNNRERDFDAMCN
jgi:hypothetical protein